MPDPSQDNRDSPSPGAPRRAVPMQSVMELGHLDRAPAQPWVGEEAEGPGLPGVSSVTQPPGQRDQEPAQSHPSRLTWAERVRVQTQDGAPGADLWKPFCLGVLWPQMQNGIQTQGFFFLNTPNLGKLQL